jgi:hypothetical protein
MLIRDEWFFLGEMVRYQWFSRAMRGATLCEHDLPSIYKGSTYID